MARTSSKKRQERLDFDYAVKEDDATVTSYGGLPLVIEAMRALGVSANIEKHIQIRVRDCEFDEVANSEALVLMMAAGGDCFDDIHMLREDKALCRMLERNLPSPETLRQYLYSFHDKELVYRAAETARFSRRVSVPQESKPLQGLQEVQKGLVRAVAARGKCTTATIDSDATIIESSKKEAQFHYDDGRGYQPALAVWVEQDLVVWDEFRDGNVAASTNAREQAQRAFAMLPPTVTKRRYRADSASYDIGLMEWLTRQEIEFSISAKMTAPMKERCEKLTEADWEPYETRSEEVVHVSEVHHFSTDWDKSLERPRIVVIRFTPTQGKLFDNGDGPKYLAVATNRREMAAADLLEWHWEKAGTIEHVHDVVKNELGGGVLPCGRFQSNAAWFRHALLTYNILSALKAISLPADLKDARPKRLRFQIFTIPAVLRNHARRLTAGLVNRWRRAAEIVPSRDLLWGQLPPLAAAG